jgi:anti-anti-sigma regulatory factor
VKGTPTRMVLCAMDGNIRKVFAMSGFDRILEIADDVSAGEARLAS